MVAFLFAVVAGLFVPQLAGCAAVDRTQAAALQSGWNEIRPLAEIGIRARTDAGTAAALGLRAISAEEAALFVHTLDGHGEIIADLNKQDTAAP